jgi:thiol-disulfide isomerase/thioredoxin
MSDDSAIFRCDVCRQLNRIALDRVKQESKLRCGTCKSVLDIPREPVWAKRGTFDRVVANWPETLLVEFISSMCVHCRITDPVVKTLAVEKAGKLKVLKIDTESDEYLMKRFKVEKTPTFIPYKNGVELYRVDGAPKEKTERVSWVENSISETSD